MDQDTTTLDKQLDDLMGVNFKDDVQPWVGAEMAIAVSGVKNFAPQRWRAQRAAAEMLAEAGQAWRLSWPRATRPRPQAFLDKQRAGRGGKGQQFDKSEYKGITIYQQQNAEHSPLAAFAMVQGYVVFASDTATINAMIDRGADAKSTLDDSPRFKGVLDNLPKAAVGYLYIDGVSMSDAFTQRAQEALSGMPPGQQQQLKDQLNNLKALQGWALALGRPEGLQFDSAVNFDTSKLDADMKAQLEDARTPADAERLKNISDNAMALLTFRIPATFKDQVMKAIKAQEGGEQALQQMEEQTGLNLEHDVLDWLVGDVSLVVLPGEKLGDVTIPATGYLALKPKDKGAAETGVEEDRRCAAAVSGRSQGIGFEEEQVGDVSWQVIKEPQSQQVIRRLRLRQGRAGDRVRQRLARGRWRQSHAPITDGAKLQARERQAGEP